MLKEVASTTKSNCPNEQASKIQRENSDGMRESQGEKDWIYGFGTYQTQLSMSLC